MPKLQKLSISGLRNLEPAELLPGAGINLIYGENGSGKTSLLEAIYLLSRAKSFRSTSRTPIIQQGASICVLHAVLDNSVALGFSRKQAGEQISRINRTTIKTQAELIGQLPLQVINADAFKILEAGPSTRRAFLDWGVFHVEHRFLGAWQKMQRALQNRNALLKSKVFREQEIHPWTEEFCQHALAVDEFRQLYLEKLIPQLQRCFERLLPGMALSLAYERGWDSKQALKENLASRLEQDRRYGHTGAGPHRADLRIENQGAPAVDLLSRGQQKLLVFAMKFAQSALLAESRGQQCLFLIDDLPAELDISNRAKVLSILADSGEQVFVTGISATDLLNAMQKDKETRLFHVKHGRISAENVADLKAPDAS